MKDTVIVSTVNAVEARAGEVRTQLLGLREGLEDSYFEMCDLLREASDGSYHSMWGYSRFGDWVEQGSGLDISARQAFYCIQISKKAAALGLTREQLKVIKISKLKEIFSLDLQEHEQTIRALIAEAPGLSLEEVKARVRKAKGQEETMFMTLKLERAIKETVDNAFELARRNYGSVVSDGEVTDISDSKAMELICVSYIQDINNQNACQAVAEEE